MLRPVAISLICLSDVIGHTQQIIKECFNNKQWKRVFSILARGTKSILKNESLSGRTKRVLVEVRLTEAQVH